MQALHALRLPALPAAAPVNRLIARLLDAWRRQQQQLATAATLRSLDDRTLRDLGFHRCEIGSVSAEISGNADITYVRSQWIHALGA